MDRRTHSRIMARTNPKMTEAEFEEKLNLYQFRIPEREALHHAVNCLAPRFSAGHSMARTRVLTMIANGHSEDLIYLAKLLLEHKE